MIKEFKLGGLTWWRNNYGSILQSFALQTELKKYPMIKYEIICQYGKKIISKDNLFNKIKKDGIFRTFKKIFWKIGLPNLKKRTKKVQSFVDHYLNVTKKSYIDEEIKNANNDFDGFIVGSDQVWNLKLVSSLSIYWCGFADDSKKLISYAPSVGLNEIPKEYSELIKKNLDRFSAISCREEKGTNAINLCLGENRCFTVLDPTMLVERKIWDDMSNNQFEKGDYIFVYMLRGTKEERKMVSRFAKKTKCKILTMPFLDTEKICMYDFSFGDKKIWNAGPDDFISLIRYAKYVFTDSFHCSVFSILYHVNFFVFPKIGNAQLNRITGLQDMFQIDSRMITSSTCIDNSIFKSNIDWASVDKVLTKKRDESKKYLDYAIKSIL